MPQLIYTIGLSAKIPEVEYSLGFSGVTDEEGKVLKMTFKNDFPSLEDEHNYLQIIHRDIQIIDNQIMLVAEDSMSQQIRFKMKKHYDGISFIDKTKKIYIDYIPPNWEADVKPNLIRQAIDADQQEYADAISKINFIHSSLTYEEFLESDSDPDKSDYIYLIWNVPYLATIQAGILTFAISVINDVISIDSPQRITYLWQTLPAQLTVQPNIGKRSFQGIIDFAMAQNFNDINSILENAISGIGV